MDPLSNNIDAELKRLDILLRDINQCAANIKREYRNQQERYRQERATTLITTVEDVRQVQNALNEIDTATIKKVIKETDSKNI